MMDAREVWQNTMDIVQGELNTPTFKTWFEQTQPLGITETEMLVSAPNDFARDWLESRYTGLLASALMQVTGRQMSVTFRVSGDEAYSEEPIESFVYDPVPTAVPVAEVGSQPGEVALNPKCTFESFVVGSSNQFAYHVALAVAETPGKAYNPLFIYGGAGLGKTHLLQAIGAYVRAAYPHMCVKYVSSERFMNDFIDSIKKKDRDRDKNRMEGFRNSYRQADVLLIDDIQFIAGKESTQTEFFHTFNTLREAGKQIVLTSDRPPAEIRDIEERLLSRFMGGLPADIQPPDLETRIAILRRKAESDSIIVPDETLTMIADRFSNNIRELEGALLRVAAYSSVTRQPITTELAQSVLKDLFPERTLRPISIPTIQQEVCKYYGINRSELIGSKRAQSIVYPRQIAMYLCRELTDHSLPKIGSEFGGRDHTTVMHANAKIQRLMNEQRDVYDQVQTLTNVVKQRT